MSASFRMTWILSVTIGSNYYKDIEGCVVENMEWDPYVRVGRTTGKSLTDLCLEMFLFSVYRTI